MTARPLDPPPEARAAVLLSRLTTEHVADLLTMVSAGLTPHSAEFSLDRSRRVREALAALEALFPDALALHLATRARERSEAAARRALARRVRR